MRPKVWIFRRPGELGKKVFENVSKEGLAAVRVKHCTTLINETA